MTFTTFDVLDNIVDLLKNDWITEFGKRPSIVKQYTETVRGNVWHRIQRYTMRVELRDQSHLIWAPPMGHIIPQYRHCVYRRIY